jgi:uncharacterized delta-60 repeat protein
MKRLAASGTSPHTLIRRVLLAALVAIALACPAAAGAEVGELDPGFGAGGWVTTPAKFAGPWSETRVQLAAAPDGGSFVATGSRLHRYLENGEPDTAFGVGGSVRISLPTGLRFSVSDLAVDPEGRAVAFGTASGMGHSSGAVVRFLPDGSLDPAFSGDGVLVSDFGLRAQAGTAALGLVDDRSRIVVLAGAIERRSRCGGRSGLEREDRVLVRLDAGGGFDLGFGGLRGADVEPLRSVATIAPAPDGGFVLAGTPHGGCGQGPRTAVIRLREDGSRVGRFGGHGSRGFTGAAISAAVDSRDRIVVLCRSRQQRARDERATKVLRLLPSGKFDPDFSGGWIVYNTEGPLYRWSTVAIRPGDHPILVGTLIRPLSQKHGGFHRWFLAVPLLANGRLESGVSWRGWAWIARLDPRSDAAASEAAIDPSGRLLIAGTAQRPRVAPDGAFAVARFELS